MRLDKVEKKNINVLFWCCLFAMLNRTCGLVHNDGANKFSKLERERKNINSQCMIHCNLNKNVYFIDLPIRH